MTRFIRNSFVLALALTGCATTDEDAGDDVAGGKADEINPTDNENLGRLYVEDPPTMAPAFAHGVRYRNVGFQIAQPVRFLKGPGDLRLESSMLVNGVMFRKVDIVAGQTHVEKLAGFTVRWDTSPNGPLAVDFGQRPQLRISLLSGASVIPTINAVPGFTGAESQPFMLFSGNYMFDLGVKVLDTSASLVGPGELKRLDLTPADKRATLRVHAPIRKQPNVGDIAGCVMKRHFLIDRTSSMPTTGFEPNPVDVYANYGTSPSYGIAQFLNTDLPQDLTVRVLPYVAADGARHYEYVINNYGIALPFTPGATIDVFVKRIDVNDVLVTREDGTTYFAPGTYTVDRETTPNVWQRMTLPNRSGCGTRAAFPTKTGVDVPPGRYRVIISYSTAEGPKTQEFVLNMP